MPKQVLETEIKVTGEGKAQSKLRGFSSFLKKNFVVTLGDVIRILKAATKAMGAFIAQGVKTIQVKRSFKLLAESFGVDSKKLLASMHEASNGTVTSFDLMEKANKALLLTNGVVADKMPKMLEIARASAKATGQDFEYLFNSMVTGLGRVSPKIIDNLAITVSIGEANKNYAKEVGKTVEQLTDQEKKIAFANEVMKKGQDIIETTSNGVVDLTENYAKLGTQVKETGNILGEVVTESWLGKAGGALSKYLEEFNKKFRAEAIADNDLTTEAEKQAILRTATKKRELAAQIKLQEANQEASKSIAKDTSDALGSITEDGGQSALQFLKDMLSAQVDVWMEAEIAKLALSGFTTLGASIAAIAPTIAIGAAGKAAINSVGFAQGGNFETSSGQPVVKNEGGIIERHTIEPMSQTEPQSSGNMSANITVMLGNKELKTIATELKPYLDAKNRGVY